MTWIYEDKQFEPDDDLIKDHIGFVYIIEELNTNMKYIGKKLFWKSAFRTKNKKRKRVKLESDWKTYYGSNKILKEKVVDNENNYKRTILRLCKTKGECSYYEAKYQFDYDVLLRDDFYNGLIMCRINSKHLGKRNDGISLDGDGK